MDIGFYDKLLKGLQTYNASVEDNFGNEVVSIPTSETKYPYTILSEIRNTANARYRVGDVVANVNYSADIYALTMGKFDKQLIARTISKIVDDYLTNLGLLRNSFNVFFENNGALCHIVVTYSGNLYENRGILI